MDKEKLDFIKANGKVFKLNVGEIVRLDTDFTHYYWLNEEFVKGITSILDEAGPVGVGLREFWKENTKEESEQKLKTAQEFGSKMHDAAERLLNAEKLNLLVDYPTQKEKRTLAAFQDWFQEWKPTDIESEQTVAMKSKIKVAGTLDLRCTIGQESFIIDFKTSKTHQKKDEWQVRAYKQAYFESFGVGVKNCGVLRLGTIHKGANPKMLDLTSGSVPLTGKGWEFKVIEKTTPDPFYKVFDTFLELHDGVIPEPPEIEVYPETMQLLQEEK